VVPEVAATSDSTAKRLRQLLALDGRNRGVGF
jgi:hypothetical protein